MSQSHYYCVLQYSFSPVSEEEALRILSEQFLFSLNVEFKAQLLLALRTRAEYKGRGFRILNTAPLSC